MTRELTVHVLVADDDRLLRDIAAATLEGAGFKVEAVASGDAAVAACARAMPDIVLLDVDMPEGDGYQACANIRALPGGFDVPIVMVTGLDDPLSINLAYDAGATDFVVKPINWALLVHRIRYVLRGARTIEALRLSEQKNSALLKAIPDGILLVNAAGSISHCFSPIPGLAATQAHAAGALHLSELLPHTALTSRHAVPGRDAARHPVSVRIFPGRRRGAAALRMPLSAECHRPGARHRARYHAAQRNRGAHSPPGVLRPAHRTAQPRVDRGLPRPLAQGGGGTPAQRGAAVH